MPVFAQQEKIPLGIYVHVPFCRSKCQYCDFYSLGGSREKGLIENYLEAVCLHIKVPGLWPQVTRWTRCISVAVRPPFWAPMAWFKF